MSYATAALATYANMLGTLDHLMTKGESHEKGDALLQAGLVEDMLPLHMQIRFTVDELVTALNRLGELRLTSYDREITSFAEARTRIAAAQALVAATDPLTWPAARDDVEFTLPNGMTFVMQAHEYCRDWATPQFYFHLMIVYSVLRMEGVPVGYIDYAGYMLKHLQITVNA